MWNAEFRMKKEILRDLSSNSPRMLWNLSTAANVTQGQRHPSFVPKGHLRIARRFNAGLAGDPGLNHSEIRIPHSAFR
jgi:hypothetical protein